MLWVWKLYEAKNFEKLVSLVGPEILREIVLEEPVRAGAVEEVADPRLWHCLPKTMLKKGRSRRGHTLASNSSIFLFCCGDVHWPNTSGNPLMGAFW